MSHDYFVECTYQLRGTEMYLLKSENAAAKANTTIYLDRETMLKDLGEVSEDVPVRLGGGSPGEGECGPRVFGFTVFDRVKSRTFYTAEREDHRKWVATLSLLLQRPRSLDKYEFLDKLGRGSYGQVFKAKEVATGALVAIKQIQKDKMDKYELHELREEIEIMRTCQHPNIVELYDIIEDTQQLFLVMEYVPGCTLHTYLKQNAGAVPERVVRAVVHQLSMALFYLREFGIIHRDLKPENIMFSPQPQPQPQPQPEDPQLPAIKLLDFGLSTIVAPHEDVYNAFGSLAFTAPEILERQSYSFPVDVYSLGVVTYELVLGTVPFKHRKEDSFIELVLKEEPSFKHEPFAKLSKDCVRLIKGMLVKKAARRVSLEHILTHAWLVKGSPKLKSRRAKARPAHRLRAHATATPPASA